MNQHEGCLDAASVSCCFPVSCETWEGLCPSGKARAYLLPVRPPFLPSHARSSGQGSWLEMVFSVVRQWRVPRAGRSTVTVARASGLSQYHTLQFVGAGGPVSPPFGFLLLLLALFWNLLPFEDSERQKNRVRMVSAPPLPRVSRWQACSGPWGRASLGDCLWGKESGKAERTGQSLS